MRCLRDDVRDDVGHDGTPRSRNVTRPPEKRRYLGDDGCLDLQCDNARREKEVVGRVHTAQRGLLDDWMV